MESDDLIKLNSPSQSHCQVEDKDYQKSQAKQTSSSMPKAMVSDGNHFKTEDFVDGSNFEAHNENDEDIQHVQDMNLEKDEFMPNLSISQENIDLSDSFESADKFETEFVTNIISTNSVSNATMNKRSADESPITSVKRTRIVHNDQQPSVRIVYNCLTRESKKMLMELMQQWSQWQAKHQSFINVSEKVALESGEDTYFSALHIGLDRANSVSFWLDNQSRKEDISNSVNLDGDMVPLYDRGFSLGLTTLDGSNNLESELQSSEAPRCFNCGSYSHALKECSKPRDNIAICNARKQHSSKRNQNPSSRSQNRYYQKTPGKFDDLKAGVLGAETRECLGIGQLDPPPWLHRMRELGYPPGYLDDVEEDHPSGITIFADGEIEESGAECEEGELPERLDPAPPKKKTTVEFPGINAPIPEKADNWLWAATPSSSYNHHSSHSSSGRPSDPHRPLYHDHQDIGPPGSAHGLAAFSRPGYSARYSSHDHNSTQRTPNLSRSLSDRSWPSPSHHETSPIYSPHSISRPSPRYHSPGGSNDHRSQDVSHHLNSNSRERDPNRHHHRR